MTGAQLFGALVSAVMAVVAALAIMSWQISLTTMAPIERDESPIAYWGYIGLFVVLFLVGIGVLE